MICWSQQLECRNCGTKVQGRFERDRISQLIPAQRHFVEVFILCEGKLNCVQEELGISYPTVRSRLDEIISALGRRVESPPSAPAARTREPGGIRTGAPGDFGSLGAQGDQRRRGV